jgi:hypothetical protein
MDMDFLFGPTVEYMKVNGLWEKRMAMESISGQTVRYMMAHSKMISALEMVFFTTLMARGTMELGEMEISMDKEHTSSLTEQFTKLFTKMAKKPAREL